MKRTLITLALLASTQAHAVCTNTDEAYIVGATADTVSTAVALSQPGFYETNPMGAAMTVVGKAALYYYAEGLPADEQKEVYHAGTSVFSGLAVNNTMLVLGAATGVGLIAGLITGVTLYNQDNAGCGNE